MADVYEDEFYLQLNKNATGTDRLGVFNNNAAVSITSSTNATPIVVTKSSHGLTNGQRVYIVGHLVNTAANGFWVIANVTTNTFELQGSIGNGVGGATGTYTADPPFYVPVFKDGFKVGETVSGIKVPTEHKNPGNKYKVRGDRNRAEGSVRVPLFPSQAQFFTDMVLSLQSGAGIPFYHGGRQWWSSTLAGSSPDTGREIRGLIANGFSLDINRQQAGEPVALTLSVFMNQELGLTSAAPTPGSGTEPDFPTEDPYVAGGCYTEWQYADTSNVFTTFVGDSVDLRNLSLSFKHDIGLDLSRPSSTASLDMTWSKATRKTPSLSINGTLTMSHTDYLRLTRMGGLRRSRIRLMMVGSNPSGNTTSTTNLAAAGTSVVVTSATGFAVGDYILLSQDTAGKQQVVQITAIAGTTLTTTAADIAQNGGTETIVVRNTALQLYVPLFDIESKSEPGDSDGIKVITFSGDARLLTGQTTLITAKAYNDNGV